MDFFLFRVNRLSMVTTFPILHYAIQGNKSPSDSDLSQSKYILTVFRTKFIGSSKKLHFHVDF